MALKSKDFSVTKKSSGGGIGYTYILRVTENSVNATENTSNITVQAILKQDYTGQAFSSWTTYYNCTINGTQVFAASGKKSLSGTSEHVYHTWSGDIKHNDDGKLSISVGGSLWQSDPASYSPPTLTIAESSSNVLALTNITVYTACMAPTTFTADCNLFENSIELSWSGAEAGQNNAITGYIIAAAQSKYGSDYEDWFEVWSDARAAGEEKVVLSIENLAEKGVNISRGDYVIFWIQTKGSAGEKYYSAWKALYSTKRNSLPSAPASATVNKRTFGADDEITVSWESASDPDDNLEKYMLQYSEDGNDWHDLAECDKENLSYAFVPSELGEQKVLYLQVCAVDALGAAGDFVSAGGLTRNEGATVPIYDGSWSLYAPLISNGGQWEDYSGAG